MNCSLTVPLVLCLTMAMPTISSAKGTFHGWSYAYATANAQPDTTGTMAGACGYGDLYSRGYGTHTTALSTALFNNGQTCGACFEVRCVDDRKWCLSGSPSVVITAIDFCPPNYALPGDNGGWCNPPRPHFDMSMTTFGQIAYWKAAIVPIQYRRVTCRRVGGVRFILNGCYSFFVVLVSNVGGDGVVTAVRVKGSRTGWMAMSRNWGQNWQSNIDLVGQSLSFEIVSSDGRILTSYGVAPPQWQFGQTFQGKQYY